MNLVQESLLQWISKQEEHERIQAYQEYENYYYGNVDLLALLPTKIREALKQDLKTCGNVSKSIVDIKTQYLTGKPCSIIVSGPPDGDPDDPRMKQAERDLYHIYNLDTNAMLQENMAKLVSITGMKGDGFVKLFQDEEAEMTEAWGILDQIGIRVLNPAHVFPKYADDDYQKVDYVVIKTQVFDEEGVPIVTAQVFYKDSIEMWEYQQSAYDKQAMTWQLIETLDNPDGFIPIQHIRNSVSDLAYGVSDLLVVTDFQDAINKTLTDLLVTLDNTAFQRIWTAGALTKPGEKLNMSPGNVIEFQDAEATLSVIQPGDVSPFLDTLDKLIEMMSMVAQIPQIAMGKVEGGAVSGYALRVQYIPLEAKCSVLRETIRNQFRSLNTKIFKMLKRLGWADYTDLEATLEFADGLPIDEVAQTQNIIMLKNAELISQETAMQRINIEDVQEEIRRIEDYNNRQETYGNVGRVVTEANAVASALGGVTIAGTPRTE